MSTIIEFELYKPFKLSPKEFYRLENAVFIETYTHHGDYVPPFDRYISFGMPDYIYSMDRAGYLIVSSSREETGEHPIVELLSLPNTPVPKHLLIKHKALFTLIAERKGRQSRREENGKDNSTCMSKDVRQRIG